MFKENNLKDLIAVTITVLIFSSIAFYNYHDAQYAKKFQKDVSACELIESDIDRNECIVSLFSSKAFDWRRVDDLKETYLMYKVGHKAKLDILELKNKNFEKRIKESLNLVASGKLSGEELREIVIESEYNRSLFKIIGEPK